MKALNAREQRMPCLRMILYTARYSTSSRRGNGKGKLGHLTACCPGAGHIVVFMAFVWVGRLQRLVVAHCSCRDRHGVMAHDASLCVQRGSPMNKEDTSMFGNPNDVRPC
jgi:hypothetical protein